MSKKKLRFIFSLALIVLIAAVTTSCNGNTAPDITSAETSEITPQPIGQGETTFRFEVVHSFNATEVWDVSTDEATIGSALFAVGLTDDTDFVTTINGVQADFVKDGYWWAFYINGEMAVSGVAETEIETDNIYAFVHTSA
ncbi:MAG: DUF4430 domain-containing protein [Oscillospiraceae bacterium]|nr:DUF4430 domain-containing protein [Oscillospiraceae bacterium]